MLKIFPIDFIRQAFEQKLLKEHNNNQELFGGKDQVNIFSFYEQLKSQDEVDRFVDNYRDLADQQNRSGLILNGVIVAPENPTITNLYSSLIIPMSFTCSMRCLIGNRDQAIWTINNLINKLKGRKVDIAQLNCVDAEGKKYSVPFMVETIGNNDNEPILKNGDYIGTLTNANAANNRITEYTQKVDDTTNRLNAVETKQTDTDRSISIMSTHIDNDGNITEVTTTTGFTFNADGMTIHKSDSTFYALHRDDGIYYYDGGTDPSNIVGQYTKDGSKQKDLALFGVYYYGMDEYDDTPMFVAQLFHDKNGEECFGHFYNRGD